MVLRAHTDEFLYLPTCFVGISELFWRTWSTHAVQPAVTCSFTAKASSSVQPLLSSSSRQRLCSSLRYLNQKILKKKDLQSSCHVAFGSNCLLLHTCTYFGTSSSSGAGCHPPGVMIYDALVVRCRSLVCKAFTILEQRGP